MSRSTQQLLAIVAVSAAAACSEVNVPSGDAVLLGPAFQTIPAGFSANSNSFDASGDAGEAFMPRDLADISFHAGAGGQGGPGGPGSVKRHGFGDGGIRGLLMGGGLGPEFKGLVGFGKGKGRGPFGSFNLPATCTFSATTGVVTCPETEKHGLKVNISYAFKDENGTAQAKFDTLSTNSVNVKTTVAGTKTHRDGAATTTVDHASDRTIIGVAPGKTSRTINGTARGTEATEGTREGVEFTSERVASDTTTNLVIPIVDGKPTIPSSGVVIRNMKVTITKEGSEPVTKSRREKVTFDGTNVVKIEITQDGVTKNCTMTLPGRDLVCGE
jgi:hypothetical protein